MKSRIAEALAMRLAPAAVVFSNNKPEGATQFKEGSMGCVAAMLQTASKRHIAVFTRKTFGCPGDGVALGFGNCYQGFPINRLLSTGGQAALRNGANFDRGEGERFHASPEITDRWLRALPFRDGSHRIHRIQAPGYGLRE